MAGFAPNDSVSSRPLRPFRPLAWLLGAALAAFFLAPGLLWAQNQAGAPEGVQVTAPEAAAAPTQGAPTEGPPGLTHGNAPFAATDLPPAAAPEAAPDGAQTPAGSAGPSVPVNQIGNRKSPLDTELPNFDLLKAMGAFIVVIILLVIFLKLLGLFTRGRRMGKGSKAFNLKGTLLIDSRRYLAAVEIDNHLVIVGVTPDRLTGLAQWSIADEEASHFGPYFNHDDAVSGPKALEIGALTAANVDDPEPSAFGPRSQARNRPRPRPKPKGPEGEAPPRSAQTDGPLALEIAQTEAPAALAKGPSPSPISGSGPGLGPGRGAGLGADPRAATDQGPILDLSLDDQVYEGSETNDDFLKMFEDEGEKK